MVITELTQQTLLKFKYDLPIDDRIITKYLKTLGCYDKKQQKDVIAEALAIISSTLNI